MPKKKKSVTIHRSVTIEKDGKKATFTKDGDGVTVSGDDIALTAEDWRTITEELELDSVTLPAPITICPGHYHWPKYPYWAPQWTWSDVGGSTWSSGSETFDVSTTDAAFVGSGTTDTVRIG